MSDLKKFVQKVFVFSLLSIMLMGLSMEISSIAHAAEDVPPSGYLPIDNEAVKNIYNESGIPTPPASDEGVIDSFQLLEGVIYSGLGYAKIILGVVGVLYVILIGYKMVMESDVDQTVSDAKRGIIYMIIGFALVSMSQDIAKIFDFGQSNIIKNPQEILIRVGLFEDQVEIVMTFIKYTIAAFATLMVVRAAASLISAGGSEEETTKEKKSILYGMGGLVLIFVGDIFINKVFFIVDKNKYLSGQGLKIAFNAGEGVKQIVGITNFIVSFAGPVAVLMLIAGAAIYASAAGDDTKIEQAKRIVYSTIIGIVIIYGAFAFVSTIIAGKIEVVGQTASLINLIS